MLPRVKPRKRSCCNRFARSVSAARQIRKDPENPQTGSGLGIDPERSGIRSDAKNPQKPGIFGDYPHQTRSGA
ncbi:hypothetical protein PGT21_028301 [Puccinia graminis f. sp. tritici]|uniref:Uncharacterized protein n=1 Tax=Puccinia graminis f. sp. tritici TaxID=56615 RepID=A0A5B0P841_PUCGR|nr:hypothetical protein PGT21_028301 [Puccinia graminis f. sp. tritici]KAA1108091.1 hypothetical protein PGTUg99_029585 [Puccinia graminis f. sp. tritici]